MKFNVNVEMSDEEIRSLAADAVRRAIIYGVGYVTDSMGEAFASLPPQVGPQLVDIFTQVFRSGQQHGQGQRPRPGIVGTTSFAPGYGPPNPYGAAPQGTRVVPMGGRGPMVERCFAIEESRSMEAGWGCCNCATYNGMQRTKCRACGHGNCMIQVTAEPVPERGPTPARQPIVTPPPSQTDDQPA
ncbi:MAG TPA: hypothetical protein VMI75_34455 [Polyangiaceae bacterium]|nr:hypothetical protein [Polyangiaceae bacterium]